MSVERPLGTDGYYYVVQTVDLASTGQLHVPDSSWVFLLYGLAGAILDPVLATHVVAALLAAAVVPAAAWAGRAHSRTTAMWLAVWMAASPTLTHLAADFPKNLGVAAPWFLLLGAAQRGSSWPMVGVATVLLATAHRSGTVWALVVLGAWAFTSLRKEARWALVGVGGLLALAPLVPGWLTFGDRFRLVGQLQAGGLAPFAWFALRPFSVAQQVELALAWPALFLGLRQVWRTGWTPWTAMSGAFLVVPLVPVYATSELDLGYRLSLLLPLVAAPLLVSGLPEVRRPWPVALLPLALFGLDRQDLPPYDDYERVIQAIPRPLPKLLIAHQGINFLYDHHTGEEAMAWAPEAELDRRDIGRLVWGLRESEWATFDVRSRVRLDAWYSFVREDDWELLRRAALEEDDPDLRSRILDWRNPARVRPAALTHGR